MEAIDALRARIPEPARDIALNLQSTLGPSSLTEAQTWGIALAAALTGGHAGLTDAITIEAARRVGPPVLDDARAAAALMAMNNVYYRFRHLVGKESYGRKPARLRMNRIARPAADRADFELVCLAVSAINGCEACVRSHEQAVVAAGLSEDQVHDAVRLAATVKAAAVALTL